jgi:hypothetical protein
MTAPRLTVLLILALAGPPAAAQDPEKAAVALLKAQSKLALKELKSDLAQHVAVLDGQLDLIRGALEAGTFDESFVESIADDLRDEQTAAYWDVFGLASWLAFATADAAALLPDGGSDGQYPAGLYVDANGTVARTCRSARKAVEKSWAFLAKRAAKVEAVAREHGVGLTIQLLPPDPQNPAIVGNAGGESLFTQPAPALLVLLAWSDLEVAGDGRVLIAAMPPVTPGGSIDVVIHDAAAPGETTFTTSVPVLAAEPCHAILDGGGELLAEGNWVVKLQAEDVGFLFGACGVP